MNPPRWNSTNVPLVREELLRRVEAEDAPRSAPAPRFPRELVRLGLVTAVVGATVAAAWFGIVAGQHATRSAPPVGGSGAPSASATPTRSQLESLDTSVPIAPAAALAEYRTAITTIPQPLPAGIAYPSRPPSLVNEPEGGDGMLRQGLGRDQAWFTWLCAWEGDYLTAVSAGDSTRRAAAEQQIARWSTMPFYTDVVIDPGGAFVTGVVDTMRAGDPSGVRADHASRCRSYPTAPAG